MVAGARSQVDVQTVVEAETNDQVFVGAAIDVGLGHRIHDGVWSDGPVRVVLKFLHSGGGPARLLEDRVLIRILGGILIHERTQSGCTVASLRVPVMVGVQTRVNQELQDLVGGGVGLLLTRQRYHAGH